MAPRFSRLTVLAAVVGVLASGALVWEGSRAAFSARTDNAGNTLTSGSVAITNDRTSGAMFAVTGLKPTDAGAACVLVTYTGVGAVAGGGVRLWINGYTANALGAALKLTVEEGSGGSATGCAGFTPTGAAIFDGTADALGAKASWNAGVGAWVPAGNATRSYRISYALPANTTEAAANLTVTLNLTWEFRTNG